MGLISRYFAEDQCLNISGIFYNDDTVQRISFSKKSGYKCFQREPISPIIKELGTDCCSYLESRAKVEVGDQLIVVGEGGFEGDGYVAYLKKSKLQWLISLVNSEAFSEVELDSGKIVAVAEYYPHENRISIPVDNPDQFQFEESYTL